MIPRSRVISKVDAEDLASHYYDILHSLSTLSLARDNLYAEIERDKSHFDLPHVISTKREKDLILLWKVQKYSKLKPYIGEANDLLNERKDAILAAATKIQSLPLFLKQQDVFDAEQAIRYLEATKQSAWAKAVDELEKNVSGLEYFPREGIVTDFENDPDFFINFLGDGFLAPKTETETSVQGGFYQGVGTKNVFRSRAESRREMASVRQNKVSAAKSTQGSSVNAERKSARSVLLPDLGSGVLPEDSTLSVSKVMHEIDGMTGTEFEKYCCRLFRRIGFEDVEHCGGAGDQGADVLATYKGQRFAIQCKRYKNPLNNKPIQEVISGKNFWGADAALVLTSTTFNEGARSAAKASDVVLWDRSDLRRIVVKALG